MGSGWGCDVSLRKRQSQLIKKKLSNLVGDFFTDLSEKFSSSQVIKCKYVY